MLCVIFTTYLRVVENCLGSGDVRSGQSLPPMGGNRMGVRAVLGRFGASLLASSR